MKYLLVNSLFYPYQRGGAEQIVYTTAKYLADQGHTVNVITTQVDENKKPYTIDKIGNITVYRLAKGNITSFHNLSALNPVLRLLWHAWDVINPYNRWSVNAIVTKIKPDVIWTHNLKGIGYVATRQLARQNAKFIATLHDVQLYEPSGLLYLQSRPWYYKTIRWIYTRLVKFIIAQPDLVISPSKWLVRFYQRKGYFRHSRSIVVKNPITVEDTHSKRQETNSKIQDTSSKIQIPGYKSQTGSGDSLKLLFIGQLQPHKGVEFLITAVQQYNQQYSAVKLTLAGDGPLTAKLSSMVANDNNIHLLPWNNEYDSTSYMQQFDLVVVPSICYENSPTVITRAHLAGLPVLAANIGGIPELIRPAKNGWLFQPDDKADFIKQLQQIAHTDLTTIQQSIKPANLTVGQYVDYVISNVIPKSQIQISSKKP